MCRKSVFALICGVLASAAAQDLRAISVEFNKALLPDVTNWSKAKETLSKHSEDKRYAKNPERIIRLTMVNRGLTEIPSWIFEKMPNLQ